MEYLPIGIALIVGVVGVATMCVAFVQIQRQGGFRKALAPTSDGKWPKTRRLLLTGALLCFGFALFIKVLSIFSLLPWQS